MPPSPVRWTARLKRKVLAEIENGVYSEPQAREFYGISDAELAQWRRSYDAAGLTGLMATKRQIQTEQVSPRMRAFLEWARIAGTYRVWPVEWTAMHRKARAAGFIECCPENEPGWWAAWRISGAGKKALLQREE